MEDLNKALILIRHNFHGHLSLTLNINRKIVEDKEPLNAFKVVQVTPIIAQLCMRHSGPMLQLAMNIPLRAKNAC